MKFKIESGIPVHESMRTGLSKTIRKMKVGDSFVIPLSIRASLACYAKRLRVVLTSHKINDKEARTWRVK